uniref:Uncharacterized protein n=1 Tax=Haptolina brevifila TaxID=156173 RepID=A0A7S2JRT7_9EUKA|mmetsp:Transcript_8963/g.18218  ORF Transcript_8963/g.18218 Transcript_8963/m.18218 type:complete len:109 (+) Transcript_8963:125-451(+)
MRAMEERMPPLLRSTASTCGYVSSVTCQTRSRSALESAIAGSLPAHTQRQQDALCGTSRAKIMSKIAFRTASKYLQPQHSTSSRLESYSRKQLTFLCLEFNLRHRPHI